ncbi:MAG TPA: DUF378 domain-containing protein [Phycisphaerae bacterium]|nr:DUF378 domain-containing protein [Phycisphaerae bacterium]
MEKRLHILDIVALVLVIVGGLNWGLVGIAKLDVVNALLGGISILVRIVYVLVGIAALYMVFRSPKMAHIEHPERPHAVA